LPGATVLIKGTAAYTTSDIDGKFNIAAGKQCHSHLQISSVGFKTQEVEIYELQKNDSKYYYKTTTSLTKLWWWVMAYKRRVAGRGDRFCFRKCTTAARKFR
jgi:hypothetical protein